MIRHIVSSDKRVDQTIKREVAMEKREARARRLKVIMYMVEERKVDRNTGDTRCLKLKGKMVRRR